MKKRVFFIVLLAVMLAGSHNGKAADANCLNACDTPPCAAGLPHGTYSYYAVTSAFPAGLAIGTRLIVMIP